MKERIDIDIRQEPVDKFGKVLRAGDTVCYYQGKGGITTDKITDVNFSYATLENGKEISIKKIAYVGDRPNKDLQERIKELETLKLYKCVYHIVYNSGDSEYRETGSNFVLAHDKEEAKFLSAMNVPFDGICWTDVYILSVKRVYLAQDDHTSFWKERPLKDDEFITVGDYKDFGQSVGIGVDINDCVILSKEDYYDLHDRAYSK